jgi:hypothetical protein
MRSRPLTIFLAILFGCFLVNGSVAWAEDVVKIGVSGPLQKEAGIGDKNAAEMAAQEIKAAYWGRRLNCSSPMTARDLKWA